MLVQIGRHAAPASTRQLVTVLIETSAILLMD